MAEEIKKEQDVKAEEPQMVDFAVTARKYKTQLTEKYKNRKSEQGIS